MEYDIDVNQQLKTHCFQDFFEDFKQGWTNRYQENIDAKVEITALERELATKAPISGLPAEILAEVFIHHMNDGGLIKPLLLTSWFWYHVALQTPMLWGCVKLQLNTTRFTSRSASFWTNAPAKVCATPQIATRILQLAGITPLHVFVDDYRSLIHFDTEQIEHWHSPLKSKLHQCRSLELQLGPLSTRLLRDIHASDLFLDDLESFVVHDYDLLSSLDWKHYLFPLSNSLHRLHFLSSHNRTVRQCALSFAPVELLGRLTYLELDGRFILSFPSLVLCQQLRYLHLHNVGIVPFKQIGGGLTVDDIPRQSHCTLPFLLFLELDRVFCSPVFECLCLPALEDLQVFEVFDIIDVIQSESLQRFGCTAVRGMFSPAEIESLLSAQGIHSPSLTRVELSTIAEDSDLISVLALKQYIEELVLTFFHTSGKPGGRLFAKMCENSGSKRREKGGETICPRLTRLTVTFRYTMPGKLRRRAKGWLLQLIAARRRTNYPLQSVRYACSEGEEFEELVDD